MANGPHTMEVTFFERGGGAGIYLKYKGADTANQLWVVPARQSVKFMANGPHTMEVTFFERGGGAGIYLKYSGADTADNMRIVPEKVLLPSAPAPKLAAAAAKETSNGLTPGTNRSDGGSKNSQHATV